MTSSIKLHHQTKSSKRNNNVQADEEEEDDQQTAVPDSTTTTITTTPEKAMSFSPGQDVLLKQKDGRFYFGTIVKVNLENEQCLVKFGDNTDSWSNYKDLTKLTTEQEDLLCVVCKKSSPKTLKEITICDKCGRGYHQKCHQPEIPIACQNGDLQWMCRRCCEPNRLQKCDLKYQQQQQKHATASAGTKVLPYDLNSLTWDTYHRVNSDHIYCYCGTKGEWYRQMLQCGKCKQWFHERCISCLQYPLYCGDRFYVFVCSMCNYGQEFVRRLELKWVDLVHLLLFNLTVYNSKKYYDLDTIVIPYINDNWHALQLPPKIATVSKNERRDNILSVLTNNRNRFKCGREIKKRTTIWGLRVRLPPPALTVTLTSFCGRMSDAALRELTQGNRRLQFLPQTSTASVVVSNDKQMRNLMMGLTYQQNTNPSESDSPCPSPELDLKLDTNDDNVYVGGGCVKKSVPYSNISMQRKRLLSVSSSTSSRERVLRRPKRRNTNDGLCRRNSGDACVYLTRLNIDKTHSEGSPLTPPTSVSAPPTPPFLASSSSASNSTTTTSSSTMMDNDLLLNTPCDTSGDDETSSKSTLDLIIPPPKDFEGKNNPFLALLKGGSGDDNDNNGKTKKQSGKKKRSKSGGEVRGRSSCGSKSGGGKSITLPLPLTAVIPGKPVMRATKRKLSEKDIFIGPNGEVKRRRLRRSRSTQLAMLNMSNNGGGQITASKTATVLPARPEQLVNSASAGSDCVDYSFANGRRLRQRPSIDNSSGKVDSKLDGKQQAAPPSPSKPSPVKQEPPDLDDLKSSVNIYFGAATRIAAGEPFQVKAKRVGPTGKLEFLIEWDGATSNGMT